MTLIFASHPQDSPPFLVADCLLSRPAGGGDKDIDLPSARNDDGPEGVLVNGLVKKLYILHPHVAVCWAGSYIQAKNYLKRLVELIESVSLIDDKFILAAGQILKDDCYNNLSIILSVYCRKTDFFTTVHSNSKEAIFPRIGVTYYSGTGSSYLENIKESLSRPETFSRNDKNLPPQNMITECRALSIAYNIMLLECINAPQELNLNLLYGGMVECCYFDFEDKTFKFIDRVKLLFWYIQYTKKRPHYAFFFGLAPRNEKEAKENIFYFYENTYSEKGLIINRYENNTWEKTPEGHILNLKQYEVENMVRSIFPFDQRKSGCYSINMYYLLSSDLEKFANRHVYLDYDEFEPWLSISTINDDQYDLKITKRAFDTSRQIVQDFMTTRYQLNFSDKESDKKEISQAWRFLEDGDNARNQGSKFDLENALNFYSSANKLFSKNNDLNGSAIATRLIGTAYEIMQKYDKAEIEFKKARKTFKKLGNLKEYLSCLLSLGILYKNLLKQSQVIGKADTSFYHKSFECLQEYISANDNMHNKEGVCRGLNALANLLWQGSNYDEALRAADDSIKVARVIFDEYLLAVSLQMRGFVKLNYHLIRGDNAVKSPIISGLADWEEARNIFEKLGFLFKAKKLLNDIQESETQKV